MLDRAVFGATFSVPVSSMCRFEDSSIVTLFVTMRRRMIGTLAHRKQLFAHILSHEGA
jgi:hypothetical protein